MKKTTFLILCFLLLSLTACRKSSTADSYQWGNDNMTRVQSYDRNGNLIEYFIAYSMYNNLMRQGGQTAVNNYYFSHRSSIDRNYSRYRSGYYSYTKRKAAAERKRSILTSIRNKQRARNAVQKSSFSFRKSKSSSSSFSSFKSSSSGRSSFRSRRR